MRMPQSVVRRSFTRGSVAVMLMLLVAAFLPSTSASAATAKLGAKCTKAGATAKSGSLTLVCKKNSKGKLVWQKYVESADCKAAKAKYAGQLAQYNDIIAKIAEAKTAAASLTGPDADVLKAQIAGTEESAKQLKILVDSLASLTLQLCKFS